MKLKDRWRNFLRFAGNYFLYFGVDLLCKTLKIKVQNYDSINKIIKNGNNVVIAFWHGTMLLPWYLHRHQNFSALVSKSKDGELLARMLTKWNYAVERGSSHRGGKEALDTMLKRAEMNYSIAITPDGPTGPPRKMKAGAVITAKKTGIPLVLCGAAFANKYKLKSWDKFEIPKPFSKVMILYSEPIYIDKSLDHDSTSKKIEECERELTELTIEAENNC